MRKLIGKYDERSAKIGFDEWNLDATEKFKDMLMAILREGMALATEESQCHVWLPIGWGPDSDGIEGNLTHSPDPMAVFVELPIGPDEDDSPCWQFSLTDLIDDIIDMHEEGEDGPVSDQDARTSLALVRDGLRGLADRIDLVLGRT